jgi:hypothetical protein
MHGIFAIGGRRTLAGVCLCLLLLVSGADRAAAGTKSLGFEMEVGGWQVFEANTNGGSFEKANIKSFKAKYNWDATVDGGRAASTFPDTICKKSGPDFTPQAKSLEDKSGFSGYVEWKSVFPSGTIYVHSKESLRKHLEDLCSAVVEFRGKTSPVCFGKKRMQFPEGDQKFAVTDMQANVVLGLSDLNRQLPFHVADRGTLLRPVPELETSKFAGLKPAARNFLRIWWNVQRTLAAAGRTDQVKGMFPATPKFDLCKAGNLLYTKGLISDEQIAQVKEALKTDEKKQAENARLQELIDVAQRPKDTPSPSTPPVTPPKSTPSGNAPRPPPGMPPPPEPVGKQDPMSSIRSHILAAREKRTGVKIVRTVDTQSSPSTEERQDPNDINLYHLYRLDAIKNCQLPSVNMVLGQSTLIPPMANPSDAEDVLVLFEYRTLGSGTKCGALKEDMSSQLNRVLQAALATTPPSNPKTCANLDYTKADACWDSLNEESPKTVSGSITKVVSNSRSTSGDSVHVEIEVSGAPIGLRVCKLKKIPSVQLQIVESTEGSGKTVFKATHDTVVADFSDRTVECTD